MIVHNSVRVSNILHGFRSHRFARSAVWTAKTAISVELFVPSQVFRVCSIYLTLTDRTQFTRVQILIALRREAMGRLSIIC